MNLTCPRCGGTRCSTSPRSRRAACSARRCGHVASIDEFRAPGIPEPCVVEREFDDVNPLETIGELYSPHRTGEPP